MENPESSEPSIRRRSGGRSALVLSAVAEAVMAELVEVGAANLSVPRVATRAGVNSSSVYRRWPNKGELIAFAGARWAEEAMPTPDLGSLHADLLRVLEQGAAFITDPRGRALIAVNFGDSGPSLDDRAQSVYWRQRLAQHQAIFERALQRGELAPRTDTQEILERAIGPLYARVLISRRPVTRAFLNRVVKAALAVEADKRA